MSVRSWAVLGGALAVLAGALAPGQGALSAPLAAVEADRQALVQGLQAQYEVALIRERKLADDRETQLIQTLEVKLRTARTQAEAARGDARAANAALASARLEYAKFAGQLTARDPATAADAQEHQAQIVTVAEKASPAKLAALQQFADGDRVGAWPQVLALTEAEVASTGLTGAAKAADLRQLADLRDEMRAHGEATTADVIALYDRAAEADPSHFRTQLERARLARDLGDLSRAREAAEHALRVAVNEDERADALRWIGEQASEQHDYAVAKSDYQQSLDLYRRLAANDASAVEQNNVATVLQDGGDLGMLLGDFQAAKALYMEGLAIRQKLADADPSDARMQDELASYYQRLGDMDEKLGDIGGAEKDFEQGLALRQKLVLADPTNTDLQYYASALMRRLGDIALERNDLKAARGQYEACLAIRQRLAAANPSSAQLQNAVALDLEDLAGVAFDQNDLATSRSDYEQSLAIRRKLAAADPTNAAMQQLILRSMARLSRISGASVGWRDVADQYAKIKKAGQLNAGDEKVLDALRSRGLAAGL